MQVPQLRRIDYLDRDKTPKTVFMALTPEQHSILLDDIGDALVRFAHTVLHRVDGAVVSDLDVNLARDRFRKMFPET